MWLFLIPVILIAVALWSDHKADKLHSRGRLSDTHDKIFVICIISATLLLPLIAFYLLTST